MGKKRNQIIGDTFNDLIKLIKNKNDDKKKDKQLDTTPMLQKKNIYTDKPSLYPKLHKSKSKAAKSKSSYLYEPLIQQK